MALGSMEFHPSQSTREVAHPHLFRPMLKDKTALCLPVKGPPAFGGVLMP